MIYRVLSLVVSLLGKFEKEKMFKLYLILLFISIGFSSQYGSAIYHLKMESFFEFTFNVTLARIYVLYN